jgi:hypothetical protein
MSIEQKKSEESMNCKELNKLIELIPEGNVTVEQMASLKNHAKQCSSCASALEDLQSEMMTYERMRSVQANPFLYTRIMSKIESQKVELFNFFPQLSRIQNMAATFLIIVSSVLIGVKGAGLLTTELDNDSEDALVEEYWYADNESTMDNVWFMEGVE